MSPAVSVIIPLYNKAPYILNTLHSVLGQTFQEFEIIVVNDGSSDGGERKVSAFEDTRIRLINQENAGVSAARNRGVAEARTDHVAFLDADDEWEPTFLETMWRLRSRYPRASLYASSYEFRGQSKRRRPKIMLPGESVMDLHEYTALSIRHDSFICASAVMMHKNHLNEIGGFPVGIPRGEDLDVWFRMVDRSPLVFFNRALAFYRLNTAGSACSTYSGFHETPLLRELETGLKNGIYSQEKKTTVIDYIAWRRFMPVNRLIKIGRTREAREFIREAWRSRKLRTRCTLSYAGSFMPGALLAACIRMRGIT